MNAAEWRLTCSCTGALAAFLAGGRCWCWKRRACKVTATSCWASAKRSTKEKKSWSWTREDRYASPAQFSQRRLFTYDRYRSSVEGKGWGGVAGESGCLRSVKVGVQATDAEQKDVICYSASVFQPRPAAGRPHTVTELRGGKKLHYHRGSATF